MDDPFVFSPQWKLARLQIVERRGVRGWVMIVKSSPSVPNTRKYGDDPLHFILHITKAKLSKHCKLLLKLFSISSLWRVYFKQIRDKFRVKSLSVDCRASNESSRSFHNHGEVPYYILKWESASGTFNQEQWLYCVIKPLRTFVCSSSWLPPLSFEPSQELRLSVGNCNTATSHHFPEQNVIQRQGNSVRGSTGLTENIKYIKFYVLAAGWKDKMLSRFLLCTSILQPTLIF